MTNSDIPIFNENNETRNYLINIYNNHNTYTLHQLINKVDDRYYKILELINSSEDIKKEFNEAYDSVDYEIMYSFTGNNYINDNALIKIIKKIIDYNF
jgi:hypothetical protein